MENYVTYEAFGAIGDGKTDDMVSICAAHDYANRNGLPVRTDPDAVYYIGGAALSAVIRTPTDWTTSQFIIDDTAVENREKCVFEIPASGECCTLPIPPLSRDTSHLDLKALGITLDGDMYVTVYSDERMQYIRLGANQDSGSPQTDSFILKKDGEILSGINWDYTKITRVSAAPIDSEILVVRGGRFTTIANQAESKYNYYQRGINVTRSNVVLEGISHKVTGEIDHGSPYAGFFNFIHCAYCVMKDCFVTGHKIYDTIGSAGVRVSMGSYDINCTGVIDIRFLGCRQEDILNRSLWGVFGSNFCKQITFDHCVLSRSDAHCGVRGYVIRNSVMGWMGTNTIGFGEMLLENVTCYCSSLIGFRSDYGCTWDGDLTLRNITWIPLPGFCIAPVMFNIHNKEQHDFGYPCTLPHHILIENVTVVDTNVPADYEGVRIFSNFNPDLTEENKDTYAEPYPLKRPDTITIRGFRALSGKKPIICENPALFPDMKVIVED